MVTRTFAMLAGLLLVVAVARADVVIQLGTITQPGSPDTLTGPDWANSNHYVTATLHQLSSGVQVTMDGSNLKAGTESISQWFFNLAHAPTGFYYVSGEHALSETYSSNHYSASGAGVFDVLFDYGTDGLHGGWEITSSASSKTSLYGISGVSINDFLGGGTYDSAANVWCHPTTLGGQVVPEPGSLLLLGTTLLFAAGFARRRINL